MKKLLIVGLMFVAGGVWAACNGPYCWDDTGASIQANVAVAGALTNNAAPQMYSRTLAQMNLLAPVAAGTQIYVSDAVQSRVCVSSGTGTGAWVIAVASSTFSGGSYPHCN